MELNSVLSFCVNTHTKQPFLFYLSWVDWGNARHFPAHCLCASPPVLQNRASRGPCGRVMLEKVHFSFHCIVMAVVSARNFLWIFFKPWVVTTELQVNVTTLCRGEGVGGVAVWFCSVKKRHFDFPKGSLLPDKGCIFPLAWPKGLLQFGQNFFLWWAVYEAAIWVSPGSVKNNHRLLLSLLLLLRLSFIPSNDRRPSSCLSSFSVLLASSAKLKLEEEEEDR